jgi:hypothetical protein
VIAGKNIHSFIMKKNRFYIIAFIILTLVAASLILTNSKTTFRRALSGFAVDDTSNVTQIFMSDKNNNSLKLTREPDGKWMVNDRYPAQKYNIDMLLGTMLDLQVKEPVAKAAHNNIIRELAVNSVKVEIYQRVYRIRFLGLRLFPHEKLTRVYYVGGATQDNRGTFMLMEYSSEPFVVYLPGFRGFVSPRYSPIEKYWRDYTIFKKDPRAIASVSVEYPSNPMYSFTVINRKGSGPEVIRKIDNQVISDYDTLKVWSFLTAFRDVNFEALLNDLDAHVRDSVLASTPFCIITMKDTAGVVSTVRTFHKKAEPGSAEYYGREVPYDLDRLYAQVNNGRDFVLIQFFVFDKIFRTAPFFHRIPPSR